MTSRDLWRAGRLYEAARQARKELVAAPARCSEEALAAGAVLQQAREAAIQQRGLNAARTLLRDLRRRIPEDVARAANTVIAAQQAADRGEAFDVSAVVAGFQTLAETLDLEDRDDWIAGQVAYLVRKQQAAGR